MASHYSVTQWRSWIDECEQSDLTVAQFCESISVSVSTYYRWRQRLRSESISPPVPAIEFVPLTLPVVQIEIELPGGPVARIANDAASLRPLVTLLLELGAKQ